MKLAGRGRRLQAASLVLACLSTITAAQSHAQSAVHLLPTLLASTFTTRSLADPIAGLSPVRPGAGARVPTKVSTAQVAVSDMLPEAIMTPGIADAMHVHPVVNSLSAVFHPHRQPLASAAGGGIGGDAARHMIPALEHAYVAVCSILKNEQAHVLEWIQYHQWIGIGKFYIFDHGSSPPLALALHEWVEAGVVEIIFFTNSWKLDLDQNRNAWINKGRSFLSPQAWAYENCFKWFGHRHKFIALMDADEYVILRGSAPFRPDLPKFLKAYEPYGGLMVHWQALGPSGHITRPNGGTLQSYTQCASKRDMLSWGHFQANPLGHMKSFTSTRYWAGNCDPHKCSVQEKQYVNQDFQPLSGRALREDYGKKILRGSGHSQYKPAMIANHIRSRGWDFYHSINRTSTSICLEGAWMHRLCFEEGQQETYDPKQESGEANIS